jgi:hypothetical protein
MFTVLGLHTCNVVTSSDQPHEGALLPPFRGEETNLKGGKNSFVFGKEKVYWILHRGGRSKVGFGLKDKMNINLEYIQVT